MFKFNIRNFIILFLLLALMLILFQKRDQDWLRAIKEKGFNIGGLTSQTENTGENKNPVNLTREYVMDYIFKNIANLSPTEPVASSNWRVLRFWFATDRDFYVEYEDSRNLRQILVGVEGQYEPLEYKIVGYFESSDNGWKLKVGSDTMFGRKLELYEWDESQKSWIKKN